MSDDYLEKLVGKFMAQVIRDSRDAALDTYMSEENENEREESKETETPGP